MARGFRGFGLTPVVIRAQSRSSQLGAREEVNASFILLFLPSFQGNTGLFWGGSPASVSSQTHPEGTSVFRVTELQSVGP